MSRKNVRRLYGGGHSHCATGQDLGFQKRRPYVRSRVLSNEDLFEATDDGYYLTSITVEGVDYDWVQFYAGDNEVGAFFESGSDRMIAEVSDGDIKGCGL